jgi:hypothetical protein
VSTPLSNDHRNYAFPSETPPTCRNGQDIPFGLTKRELFAAMAMQSLITKAPVQALPANDPGTLPEMCARGAVDYADALLTALDGVAK